MKRNYNNIMLAIFIIGMSVGLWLLASVLINIRNTQSQIKDQTEQRAQATDKILNDSQDQTLLLCTLILRETSDVPNEVEDTCRDRIKDFNSRPTGSFTPSTSAPPNTSSEQDSTSHTTEGTASIQGEQDEPAPNTNQPRPSRLESLPAKAQEAINEIRP